jgi:4'-phosphopantetheinyl transferase
LTKQQPLQFARVWLARIETEGLDDTSLLSPVELARLASMSHAKRRRQFIAGRVLAKKLIAAMSGDGAERAVIDVSATGKPYLADRPDLHFSISHSGHWVACVVASVAVGLDIERIDSKRSTRELIEEVCSKEEQRLLATLPGDRRDQLFTEFWTLKEAWQKRQGRTLDVERMRAIKWRTAAPPEGNCVSWMTDDALAISVVGPSARSLLGHPASSLAVAHCTLRQVEDA